MIMSAHQPHTSATVCQADAIHLYAEDPTGLSSHARLVIVVAAGRNDPPQVHVPGATYVEEPCDSREGRIGFSSPQHPPPLPRQCRRITAVNRVQAYEDTVLVLEGVFVEDSDVEEGGTGAQIDVEVEAKHGSLGFTEGTANPPRVLPLHDEDQEEHLLSMRGALDSVNDALARLTYTPDPDWSGSDELVVRANDRGFTGSGGEGRDSRAIPIEIVARKDAPLLLVTAAGIAGAGTTAPPPILEMLEDARITLHNVTMYDADVNPRELHGQILGVSTSTPYDEYPVDANGGLFEVTVRVGRGRVFFRWTSGLAFAPPVRANAGGADIEGQTVASLTTGAKFSTLGNSNLASNETAGRGAPAVPWWREAQFVGRLDDCNRALAAMTYWPDVNWNGVDSVHIRAAESRSDKQNDSNGETADAPPLFAEATMYVRVAAVNDAPVVTPPLPKFHSILRTGDLLSPLAIYGGRVLVAEDNPLQLPGFFIRDVDLTEGGDENTFLTVTVTSGYGMVSLTWHGTRAGVGPGDSRHPDEENSLGADLTGLLFRDQITKDWGPLGRSMGVGATTFTFRASLADANAALQSLTFTPANDFFGSGAWVRVEAFDEGLSGQPIGTATGRSESTATNSIPARGVATVPITVLAVNDAPSLQLPFSEDGQVIIRLDEGEERRLDGARWRGSIASTVQASAYHPFRKGMELWRSQGVFPAKDAGRWGNALEMEWKEVLVADLNEGLGDGSPRHFLVWQGYLYFQVTEVVERRG